MTWIVPGRNGGKKEMGQVESFVLRMQSFPHAKGMDPSHPLCRKGNGS